ncbi:MAG: hypothetical protein FWD77_00140 [Betaproteobacteria bacterium]|nr:hypothetical protein [Betaproteobacteria bacterium]
MGQQDNTTYLNRILHHCPAGTPGTARTAEKAKDALSTLAECNNNQHPTSSIKVLMNVLSIFRCARQNLSANALHPSFRASRKTPGVPTESTPHTPKHSLAKEDGKVKKSATPKAPCFFSVAQKPHPDGTLVFGFKFSPPWWLYYNPTVNDFFPNDELK